MTRETDSRVASLTMKLSPAASEHLFRLAEEAGLSPSRLAKELLEEILPKVSSVRRRVQITMRKTEENGRSTA